MESAGGNCLFAAIKVSINVHHSNSKDVPYYPTRYFRRQVVADYSSEFKDIRGVLDMA